MQGIWHMERKSKIESDSFQKNQFGQMKQIISILFLVMALNHAGRAQDPHFSQFFSSPLTLNPAYTGLFDGNFRVAGNYRNQWPTINNAFTTATASFDMPVMQKRLPEYDRWGVGLIGLNDRSGNKILNNNHIAISTAYHKALDENGYHQLTVGFQGTFTSKQLDVTKADFEDELTALGFTGVTSEVLGNSNKVNISYFDLNAGLLYSGTTNGENNFYLGASVYHVNRPNESFLGGSFILEPRVTIHGGGYLPLDFNKTLHTSFIHQRQAGTYETVIGASLSFNVTGDEYNPIELYTGLWYRLQDAIIPYVGLEFGAFRLGFSYDLNNSSLNTASNRRGGSEISLIYVRKPVDWYKRKMHCPKF
jgi:type IX secretion system PorP/SprF family membrane protein